MAGRLRRLRHEQMATVKAKAAQGDGLSSLQQGLCFEAKLYQKSSDNNRDEGGATMTYIPDTLSILLDGSMLVHRLEPTLHVYYNSNTVQMAARNWLHTLVADRVHSFQHRQLKRKGQLYTVHGLVGDHQGSCLLPSSAPSRGQSVENSPVAREHPAYGPCSEFLKYLEETWYTGMFADLWNKFEVEELRTTKEAYHRYDYQPQPNCYFSQPNLFSANSTSYSWTDPSHEKYIRTKDRERRETIAQEMRRYLSRHPFLFRN
ncbi:hypothetical protein ANCCAN_17397, partial [Ancylostoma caninum]